MKSRIQNRCFAALLCALMLAGCGNAVNTEEAVKVPKINYAPKALPDLESFRFAQDLAAGWNLGNTFDAVDVTRAKDDLEYESAWVGVRTDPRVFDTLKAAGFTSVRIPVSWHNHVSGAEFTISPAWLARVKEVTDAALERGLFVIINTHHDIAKGFLYPDASNLEVSKRYLASIWRQVGEAFRDYDTRLVMESMNEPRLAGTAIEWTLDPADPAGAEAVRCINALNQVFVDTVRSSGGMNASRYLLVPGYAASVQGFLHEAFQMPADVPGNRDRLMVSVHAYTPYDFALQSEKEKGSRDSFSASNPLDVNAIATFMDSLYQKSIALAVPVVIGEFGARNKGGNLQSRVDFTAVYTALAKARGIPCFWWDNHSFTGNGELFGLLDRKAFTIACPQIAEALVRNAE